MTGWIAGIFAAVVLGFGLGYHFGGMAPKLSAANAVVKKDTAQVAAETKQLTVDTQAEAAHDQAIEHPPALVINHPVWLHEPQVCPAGVPVPAGAADSHPSGGAADPGPSVDLRPQLAAFAQKYEAALADCRRMAAEWPR